MVFGEIERDARRHRWCNVLLPIFFAISVHVDVQAFVSHVVAVHTCRVVVIPYDWCPLAFVLVLQLHDKPRHIAVIV